MARQFEPHPSWRSPARLTHNHHHQQHHEREEEQQLRLAAAAAAHDQLEAALRRGQPAARAVHLLIQIIQQPVVQVSFLIDLRAAMRQGRTCTSAHAASATRGRPAGV